MKPLICPFCGASAIQKSINLGDGSVFKVNEVGIVTFAWEDDGETAYENNIHLYECTVNSEHLFFIPA